ncbi:MAG: helix-turn-helix domain-containing protein [Patescibacteria group bacterium]|nr:helix-turn-helix domain-containing protein [Patescibacteria group bacterium]
MPAFRIKTIDVMPTLGQELASWRERRGLSTAEAAERAGLQEKFIVAFEKNDFSELPEILYSKNYLRAYLRALGLKEAKFIPLFEHEWNLAAKVQGKTGHRPASGTLRPSHLIVAPRLIKIFLVSIAGLAIIGYLGWQINALLRPPSLIVTAPPDDFVTVRAQAEIQGKTDAEALVKINDQAVVTDSEGRFNHTLDLQRGLNIVTIEAWKRHSRAVTVYKKIIMESNED